MHSAGSGFIETPLAYLPLPLYALCWQLLSVAVLPVQKGVGQRDVGQHGPIYMYIAFRHLPPNSARFGYASEGELFISAQLSTDAVSALRKVWVLI